MLNIERLYELMRNRGIETLAELCRKARVPYTTLNYMINGHDMHVSTVLQIAKYFEVPIDDLIYRNYRLITVREDETIFTNLSNVFDVFMSIMV